MSCQLLADQLGLVVAAFTEPLEVKWCRDDDVGCKLIDSLLMLEQDQVGQGGCQGCFVVKLELLQQLGKLSLIDSGGLEPVERRGGGQAAVAKMVLRGCCGVGLAAAWAVGCRLLQA